MPVTAAESAIPKFVDAFEPDARTASAPKPSGSRTVVGSRVTVLVLDSSGEDLLKPPLSYDMTQVSPGYLLTVRFSSGFTRILNSAAANCHS